MPAMTILKMHNDPSVIVVPDTESQQTSVPFQCGQCSLGVVIAGESEFKE